MADAAESIWRARGEGRLVDWTVAEVTKAPFIAPLYQ
jgi:hypothetical protein